MWPVMRSTIILLLGLYACFGQEIEDYEGNDQSAIVSAKKNQHDVSILKQIHRHNEDGSYTYGYEASDGSFKIETKTRTGEVTGKYGYVDDAGKLRVVEYGANIYGFQPSGDGITVPSPTLVELHREDESNEESTTARKVGKTPSSKKPSDDRFEIRPKSIIPAVGGSFVAAPEDDRMTPPSGTYQSVQEFGVERSEVRRPTKVNRGLSSSYQTYEDSEDRTTGSPLAKRRNDAGSTRTAVQRTNPKPTRTGSILEGLIEQYALPESGSPVAHSVSFGNDP